MAQRKGFSLIEIMICLGVMIAFARLVLPSAAGYSSVGLLKEAICRIPRDG